MTTNLQPPSLGLPPAPKPHARPDVLEAYLEQYFAKAVRALLRGKVIKMAPVEAGTPDRLVMVPGLPLMLVELKTTRGTLEPLQKVWHARAARRGHPVTVLAGTAAVDRWVAAMQRKLNPDARGYVEPAPQPEA